MGATLPGEGKARARAERDTANSSTGAARGSGGRAGMPGNRKVASSIPGSSLESRGAPEQGTSTAPDEQAVALQDWYSLATL